MNYPIKHTCGHTVYHYIKGKKINRPARKAEIAATICYTCFWTTKK